MRTPWSSLIAALVIVAAPPLAAQGPAPAAPVAPPTAPAKPLVIELEGAEYDDLQAWMAARLTSARAGRREIVRVPVAARSLGWGCRCPSHYVGVFTDGNMLGLGWLSLDLAPGLSHPPEAREGQVVLVEGWFTGTTETEDLRNPDGEPEDWLYTLDKLHVTRLRPMRSGDPERLEVVLGPPESTRTVEPLPGDLPWAVLVGSADLQDPKTERWADKLVAKLRAHGFEAARSLDSRQLPALWCCKTVVVAGLYATPDEARKVAKQLKKKGYQPQVRQGF